MAETPSIGLPAGVLNLNTPLAFLTPEDAFTVSMLAYVCVACFAIMAWDALNYLREDYLVVFHSKFTWKTSVFVIARLAPLGFLLTFTLFFTTDKLTCKHLHDAAYVFFVLSSPSAALLFYFRVCAVYSGNRFISIFFAFTWFIVFVASLLIFWGMESGHIEPTKYCITHITGPMLPFVAFSEMFNDTLIYLTILYKLGGNAWKMRRKLWRTLFPGHHNLADVVVEDSLIYYFIAASMNMIRILIYFALHSKNTSALRVIFAFPNTVVISSVALRVFRNMKLGHPGLLPRTRNEAVAEGYSGSQPIPSSIMFSPTETGASFSQTISVPPQALKKALRLH